MDKKMHDYLNQIDRYLKPMAAAERADIINEIKSEMLELEAQKGMSAEEILERLGESRELAKAYMGEAIVKNNTFSLRKFSTMFAFYGLAGFTGMFILPIFSVLSVGLMFCGAIAPVAGIVKFLGFLVGIEVPWVMFQFGTYTAPAYVVFPLSVVTGVLLFAAGWGLWKLMIRYIRTVSLGKRKLQQQE